MTCLWLLGACATDEGSESTEWTETRDDSVPDIVVEPRSLTLEAPVGGQYSAAVTVTNHGLGDLLLAEIQLAQTGSAFDLGAVTSVLIPPEAGSTFSVTFTPTASGTAMAFVTVVSNDPESGSVEIPVWGVGGLP